jgi:hypothetical protein
MMERMVVNSLIDDLEGDKDVARKGGIRYEMIFDKGCRKRTQSTP